MDGAVRIRRIPDRVQYPQTHFGGQTMRPVVAIITLLLVAAIMAGCPKRNLIHGSGTPHVEGVAPMSHCVQNMPGALNALLMRVGWDATRRGWCPENTEAHPNKGTEFRHNGHLLCFVHLTSTDVECRASHVASTPPRQLPTDQQKLIEEPW
jgi:hypothetical protein